MQFVNKYPSIGGLIPIPFAVGTIPDPSQWECDSVEEVLDLCRAITEVTEDHEELGISYEWNGIDGWEYLSSEEDVIKEYCDIYQGDSVEEMEEHHEIFYEAVLREYQKRAKVYSQYSLDDLVSHWRPKYVIGGDGYFVLNPQGDVVEPRVKTTEEEEE